MAEAEAREAGFVRCAAGKHPPPGHGSATSDAESAVGKHTHRCTGALLDAGPAAGHGLHQAAGALHGLDAAAGKDPHYFYYGHVLRSLRLYPNHFLDN